MLQMEVVFLQAVQSGDTFLLVNLLDLGNPFRFAVRFESGVAALKDTKGFGDQLIRAEAVFSHIRKPISVML